jgi:hypothetical protein
MRPLLLPALALGLTVSAPTQGVAEDCGSIISTVCEGGESGTAAGAKVLTVKTTDTRYLVGDRFPYETRSLLMDPRRYSLPPSDGTWRYYAMAGVVYRVETDRGMVLEVIRNRHTAHLR